MKIMLVEDDYLLNKAIKLYFKNKFIDSFTDGLEAYESINNGYDVFIVDIDVPNLNGIELLQEIRKIYSKAYIIMISATIDIAMIDKAYKYGCNDYMKKPFDIKELELKLNLVQKENFSRYKITDELHYDFASCQFYNDEEIIKFSKKEFKLISLLLNNRGKLVSIELITDTIWENGATSEQIRQLISRVNKKLPSKLIENRASQGYILV